MKKLFSLMAVVFITFGLTVGSAEAKRLGGGGNSGKQRSSPTMQQQAPKSPAQAAPAPAQAATTPGMPAAPVAKPSFMQKWGGMIAGFGMGALLGSMFGGNMAGLGGLLNILLIGGALYLAYKFFVSRKAATTGPMQYAGAGAPVLQPSGDKPVNFGGAPLPTNPVESANSTRNIPAGFDVEPFERQAKTAFIRLQAANDAKDLNDIREFTTPEMYAELSMQIQERGNTPQKTEVVTLNAEVIEVVTENDFAIASVRYSGMIREAVGALPEPLDEVWHVQKNLKDAKSTWQISGIQQMH